MLYDSYEQVVMRDRPWLWWRPGVGVSTMSVARPGSELLATTGSTPSYAGPGLPGAANGWSTFTYGTVNNTSAQNWFFGGFTLPGPDVSMEAWFYPTALQAGRLYNLFVRGNNFGLRSDAFDVRMRCGNTTDQLQKVNGLRNNMWHHIVARYRTGENQLWVNGELSQDVQGGTPITADISGINFALTSHIGLSANPSGTYSFPGYIAEPAFYAYALSPSQIIDHYQAGIMPRRSTSRLASIMYPFAGGSTPPPPPGGLTPITEGLANRRIALVSDRPR